MKSLSKRIIDYLKLPSLPHQLAVFRILYSIVLIGEYVQMLHGARIIDELIHPELINFLFLEFKIFNPKLTDDLFNKFNENNGVKREVDVK